jgi:hypothetical protein
MEIVLDRALAQFGDAQQTLRWRLLSFGARRLLLIHIHQFVRLRH